MSPSQIEESVKYRALYRFDAKNSDELSLIEGDVVMVTLLLNQLKLKVNKFRLLKPCFLMVIDCCSSHYDCY